MPDEILQAKSTRKNTLLGLVAILFWSTTIAFSRSLTEQLGIFTAAALIYILAGLAGLVYEGLRPGGLHSLARLPRTYLLVCGGLFVLYITTLYLAVGMATTRIQVIAVGLINYLWPAFSLVFSIPILKRRAGPLLPVGILLALAGTWLATTSESAFRMGELLQDWNSLIPYGLALAAALSWALYSNLSRRLGEDNESGAVPLFLLASGLLLGFFRLFVVETPHWTLASVATLAYMALFPGLLAYIFWDFAVRKGEIILVASLSYLTPLLSTVVSALVLNILPGAALWAAAALVIGGALLCQRSINDH
jgi:drug/metabolite transporter (DMT)-like permease